MDTPQSAGQTLAINGANLTAAGQSDPPRICVNGACAAGGSISVTGFHLGGSWNVSDTVISMPYWVDATATTGSYTMDLITAGGTATVSFAVRDGTPVITGVSPNTLVVSEPTTVTITGSHFGTNTPQVSLSLPNDGGTVLSGNTDSQIQVSVTVTAAGTGTFSVTAEGYGGQGFAGSPGEPQASAPSPTVAAQGIQFQVQGSAFIFVGSDPQMPYANQFGPTNGSGGAPSPPGGTLSGTSSDSKDKFIINLPFIEVTTPDQSATDLDRTLTFSYKLPGGASASQALKVTARQFAYATNNTPQNSCALKYGTNQLYTYSIYTHPDKQAITGAPGLSGTVVTETFSPALTCETKTATGALNGEGQFEDQISSGCSSVPLTCTQKTTQTLTVGGFSVRSNTLQWTANGVTYTNNGPNK